MSTAGASKRQPKKRSARRPLQSASAHSGDATREVLQTISRRLASLPPPSSLPDPTKPTAFNQSPGTLEQVGREADMAWNGVKKIMSLLNVETKRVVSGSSVNVSYSGFIADLTSSVSQGVSGTQRIGDSLKAKRAHVKGTVSANGAGSSYTAVLGYSKEGAPSLSDVFYFTGSARAGMNYPQVLTEPADHWVLSVFRNVSTTHLVDKFELNHVFNHDVTYIASTTTVASGSVWFAIISDVNASVPVMDYTFAFDFVDN